jgi:hypothetical protein
MDKEFLIMPFKTTPIGHPFRYKKNWWIKIYEYVGCGMNQVRAQKLDKSISISINPEVLVAVESNIITKFLLNHSEREKYLLNS